MLVLALVLSLLALSAAGEREHKVHNIVLFREKYSWCKLTPIQQIITSPGYDSITINNNICVGACYSYSIPKTQPAEPGEIIGPYCDSCQPNITKCYHVTLKADGNNLLGPKTIQKQIEIIESCDCKTCDKDPKVGCQLTSDTTVELPQHMHTNRDSKLTPANSELPDADLMDLKPDVKANTILDDPLIKDEKKFELTAKLLKLLKSIQNDSINTVLKYDKEEINELLEMVQGVDKKLDDKHLIEFVNYVNSNNVDDLEVDIQKLKEFLTSFQKNKDLIEKHRNFWLEVSDNAKIEEDIRKLKKPKGYGIEGNNVGMQHHFTGSHIAMGIHQHSDGTTSTTEQSQISSSVSPIKHHHHYVMETENVNGKLEHLVKGPHGSLVLTPDIKVEEKLNLGTDALKPNHQGMVISYTAEDLDRPKLLDD